MAFTEEEIQKAAELKLWVESRLLELQGEIEKLREVLAVVDGVLRKTSFKTAAEIVPKPITSKIDVPTKLSTDMEFQEVRPLKRTKDGFLLANAYISPSSVAIIPASEVRLNESTPPFKSFFINRILEGMKTKDTEHVSQGKLKAEEVINYQVEDEGGIIKRIIVDNYRDKIRLSEIINTVTWVFARMLEKKR